MADSYIPSGRETGAGATYNEKVIDNGDGTFSPAVVVGTGSNIMGKVGIDQTTPGTTNGVQVTGSITPTHTAVNVTTTTGEVLAANANRKYALLINDSEVVIYLKIAVPAVLNEGIRLNANGGSYEMSSALGNLATGAINGIHGSTGNKVLLVLEGE